MIYIEKMLKQKGLERDAIKTKHAHADRSDRLMYCYDLIDNEHAVLIDSFKVDKHHKNGLEIHNIYSNGVIMIYNLNSRKLVTGYAGTYRQVRNYYNAVQIKLNNADIVKEFCNKHINK